MGGFAVFSNHLPCAEYAVGVAGIGAAQVRARVPASRGNAVAAAGGVLGVGDGTDRVGADTTSPLLSGRPDGPFLELLVLTRRWSMLVVLGSFSGRFHRELDVTKLHSGTLCHFIGPAHLCGGLGNFAENVPV